MARRPIRSALLATALLLACNEQPLGSGSGESEGYGGLQAASVAAESEIQALADAQMAAWSTKDATAFAATFSTDARFLGPTGQVAEGRAAIRAQHAFLFAGPFAGTTETLQIVDIRFLTGTIAVVYLQAALAGLQSVPPGLPESEPGVVRTTKTWVVQKRAGTWLIVTQHMAPVVPS